jgi:hypothetical protein
VNDFNRDDDLEDEGLLFLLLGAFNDDNGGGKGLYNYLFLGAPGICPIRTATYINVSSLNR